MEADSETGYTLFSGPDPLEALNFKVYKDNCGDVNQNDTGDKIWNRQSTISDGSGNKHISNTDNFKIIKKLATNSKIDLNEISPSPESIRIELDKFKVGVHPYHYTGPYIKQETFKLPKKKMFQCPFNECKRKFLIKSFLKSHLISHSNGNFVCKFCYKVYKDKNQLKKHEFLHFDKHGKLKSFECPAPGCNQVCLSYKLLCDHETSHHNQDIYVYKCKHCSKTFLSLSLYYKHNSLHHLPLVHNCLECGKCFKSLGELNCHRKLHKNNQEYMCQLCGLQFKKLGNLNRHKKIHTGKNFYCKICFANFNYAASLTRHMVKNHPNARKRQISQSN